MKGVLAMLLAGGAGTRLNALAVRRAKPAVPFGGIYRIIDFTLSNLMHAGVKRVGVLTQYRPTSLMRHLSDGAAWDLAGRTVCLRVLPPFLGKADSDWYRGTADAVFQNVSFIRRYRPDRVLIVSGDHIYNMDFARMIREHEGSGAEVTVACMEVPIEEAPRFGIIVRGASGAIEAFHEKPKAPPGNLASMGIYVFERDVLFDELRRAEASGGYDFGKDIFPSMVGRRRLNAWRFDGYWRDVGTIDAYYEANMDILNPRSGLDPAAWRVRTCQAAEMAPAFFGPDAVVRGSMVSRGCRVMGRVSDSVLSPGVVVEPGAEVVRSVVMHGCTIRSGAMLDRAILDKGVVVGEGAVVGRGEPEGANRLTPGHLSSGLAVVGKGSAVPASAVVGRNAIVAAGLLESRFPPGGVPSGATLVEGGILK